MIKLKDKLKKPYINKPELIYLFLKPNLNKMMKCM